MAWHYIPVSAKRHALEVYRYRRRYGAGPTNPWPLDPMDAIDSTVEFFAGHLAFAVAYDQTDRVPKFLNGYRAATHYRQRMSKKTGRHWQYS
jgi:hypothetical protein